MKGSLLYNEPPLQIIPSLAIAIGLNEAVALQQLHFLAIQKGFGKTIDGKKWIFNTYSEWRETYFKFWSERTVERIFESLHKKKMIESCQPEGRASRRKYYRLADEALRIFMSGEIPEGAKMADSEPEPANLASSEPAILSPSCAGASISAKTTPKTTDVELSQKSKQKPPETPINPLLLENPEFLPEWGFFIEHRKRLKKPLTGRAEQLILKKLSQHPRRAVEALQRCMEKGWQSFEWHYLDEQPRNGSGLIPQAKMKLRSNL